MSRPSRPILKDRSAMLYLALLFTGVLSTSALIPYMAVYIVETLGRPPWQISLYAVPTLLVIVITNRLFGRWIDAGTNLRPLLGMSIAAFAIATASQLLLPGFTTLLVIGAAGFGISSASVTTMYSLGRLHAERAGLDLPRYNAWLRATTSLGWMIAPTASVSLAAAFGAQTVFACAFGFRPPPQ